MRSARRRMARSANRVDRTAIGIGGEPTLRDVSEALIAIYGTDFGIHSPAWISRFTDMTRQAAAYRDRTRPAGRRRRPRASADRRTGPQHRRAGCGEPGMEAGAGRQAESPESLLDTYHAERHPVAARVLRNTMAQVALRRTDERSKALSDIVVRAARAWTSRANDWPRRCLVSAFTTTSARGIRCSAGACPISISSPPTARCGCSPAARCAAGAAQFRRARRIRHRSMGRSRSADRRQVRRARGSCRRSGRSRLPPPCWFGPTDMWRGWES